MNRPRTATFLLEIRLTHHDARADVLALLPARQLRSLLGRMGAVQRPAAGGSIVTCSDRFTWCRLPAHLDFLKGRASHGLPLNLRPDSILERRSVPAELLVASSGVQWKVPATEWGCAFETAFILWDDLLEWALMMAKKRDVSRAFRRLAAYDPDHALDVLKRDGTLLCEPTARPHRVAIPVDALGSLLAHEADRVRETAMKLLGRAKPAVNPRPAAADR